MSNYLVSLIRTAAPALVGAVLTWLALHGVDLPADRREALTVALTGILVVLYYAVVRALEKRWPKLGVLLGVPSAPVYGKSAASGAPHPVATHPKKASVGRAVHYVAAEGDESPGCRAAIVTVVPPSEKVGLFVANPTGTTFVTASPHDEKSKSLGTWHWPE